MKKTKLASFVIITTLLFSQATFAEDEQAVIQNLNQQLQELTKDDLLAATQSYMLEKAVTPKARRSTLFAYILDAMVKNATLAKIDKAAESLDS